VRLRRRHSSADAPLKRLALDSPTVSPEATVEPLGNGAVRIATPPSPWHQAAGFPLGDRQVSAVLALVRCTRGAVGAGVLDQDGLAYVAPETIVPAGETRLLSVVIAPGGDVSAGSLMIRNGGIERTACECEVLAAFAGDVPSVELTDEEVMLALRNPVAARASCAR
jgi:hypothetical protein